MASALADIPPGKVAAIVTSLQMSAAPPARPDPPDFGNLRLRSEATPSLDWYRALFRKVGADWLWLSRLTMSDAQLTAILFDPAVEVFVLMDGAEEAGMLELDFRTPRQCELAFFGLAPGWIGKGAGRWLMNRAIERAWARPISRLWVHTCTHDHPGALEFYIRSGFQPFRRQVEVADDPRLAGQLPKDKAPHIPVL